MGRGYIEGKGEMAILMVRVFMAILRKGGHGYIEGKWIHCYTD